MKCSSEPSIKFENLIQIHHTLLCLETYSTAIAFLVFTVSNFSFINIADIYLPSGTAKSSQVQKGWNHTAKLYIDLILRSVLDISAL